MVSSSRGLSIPPRSARASASRTSFTPENDGLPRRPMRARAASVSSCKRRTSSASVEGVRRRARSFAASLTAFCERRSKSCGSSSTRMDFSNSSVMVISYVDLMDL